MAKDAVEIGKHIEGCNALQYVQEKMSPHPWSVYEARFVMGCNEDGIEMTQEELIAVGKAETWLELPCFGTGCQCKKRVRVIAIAMM